jgi:hypothetical protein
LCLSVLDCFKPEIINEIQPQAFGEDIDVPFIAVA